MDYEDMILKAMTFSVQFKRKMNRVFREKVGTENIPHPEVDNGWERLRSRIMRKWTR